MYTTPPRSAAAANEPRSRLNTVNTGKGKHEKRLQLWRPPPLELATSTSASDAFTGKMPPAQRAMREEEEEEKREVPESPLRHMPLEGFSTARSAYAAPDRATAYNQPMTPPSAKKQEELERKLPFQGTSTTRAAFASPDRSAISREGRFEAPSEEVAGRPLARLPFQGESTTRSAYESPKVRSSFAAAPAETAPTEPPVTPQRLPFQGQSTTRSAYTPLDRETLLAARKQQEEQREQPVNAARKQISSLPLTGESTTRSTFVPASPDQRAQFQPTTEQQRTVGASPQRAPSLPFQGESTSRSTFSGIRPVPQPTQLRETTPSKAYFVGDTTGEEVYKPAQRRQPLPFVGTSSTRSAFPGHVPSPDLRPREPEYKPEARQPSLPLQGTSTLRSDYPGQYTPQKQAAEGYRRDQPDSFAQSRQIPLEGTSTLRSDYPGYSPQRLDQEYRRPDDDHLRLAQKLPLQGTSSLRSDYPGHVPSPQRAQLGHARDDHLGSGRKIPLQGTSTLRSDFPGHQPQVRDREEFHPHAQVDHLAQPRKLPLQGSSTLRADYPGHTPSREREEINRPVQDHLSPVRKIPFEGTSSLRSDYPGHIPTPQRQAEFRRGQEDHLAPVQKLPFQGTSTSAAEYPGHFPRPKEAEALAEERRAQASPARIPFKGTSTAQADYPGHIPVASPRVIPPRAEEAALSAQRKVPLSGTTEAQERFVGWKLPEHRPALGIEMYDDVFFEMVGDTLEGEPFKNTFIFTTCADEQSAVEVKILQLPLEVSKQRNDNPDMVVRASDCDLLGTFELVGIPPAPCAVPQIAVTFSVDSKGVLHVSAEDKQSGVKTHIAVDRKVNKLAFA